MTSVARQSGPIALPVKRGLSRPEAAGYVGVGPTTFDKMIAAGQMPQPIRIGGRILWDLRALDVAFDALSSDGEGGETNTWDEVLR